MNKTIEEINEFLIGKTTEEIISYVIGNSRNPVITTNLFFVISTLNGVIRVIILQTHIGTQII